jgi:hypothetical protein
VVADTPQRRHTNHSFVAQRCIGGLCAEAPHSHDMLQKLRPCARAPSDFNGQLRDALLQKEGSVRPRVVAEVDAEDELEQCIGRCQAAADEMDWREMRA